jgi:hypothetical protein
VLLLSYPHGNSASKEIIDHYIAANFSEENFTKELSNSDFQYYLIYYKTKISGFSKVIFNSENKSISGKNILITNRNPKN